MGCCGTALLEGAAHTQAHGRQEVRTARFCYFSPVMPSRVKELGEIGTIS